MQLIVKLKDKTGWLFQGLTLEDAKEIEEALLADQIVYFEKEDKYFYAPLEDIDGFEYKEDK